MARRGLRARLLSMAVVTAVVGGGIAVTARPAGAASTKITICHRTHSTTNPYRKITVSQNAVQNSKHGGHDLPTGSLNPAVYDPTFTYAPSNKYWGDVIPGGDAAGLPYNGTNQIALNWTAAGKSDFSTYCAPMTPTAFYNAEIAAGQTQTSVLADLNSQDANEDVALLASLGGSFTTSNLSSWDTAVTVTTDAATQVDSTGATLNGTLKVGSTSTVSGFRYGTSPTLDTSVVVTATPSPVTDTTSVSAGVTGLTPGTTYYFMATGTTNAGLDTEGILTGSIISFTTTASTTTTSTTSTSTTSTSTTSTTVPTSTTSTTAPSTTTSTMAPSTTTSTTVPISTTSTTAAVPSTTSTSTTVVPVTTSTTAPTSTTTSPTVAPGPATTPTSNPTTTPGDANGSVHGIVWFDRNRNTVFDGNEWVLPGVTVTLDDGTARSSAAAVGVKAQSAQRTAVTAADGSYNFTGLPAGAYRVTAAASIRGFDYTSDTDGAADWKVAVAVLANAISVADFAGLGHGTVVGQVFEEGTRKGIPGASIQCRWSGYDDVPGDADDVTFAVTAGNDGSFDMSGVPYGFFTCDGRDQTNNRISAPVTAEVMSAEAVRTPLPLASSPASAGISSPRHSTPLPMTGTDTANLVRVAIALLIAGAATASTGNRRGRRLRSRATPPPPSSSSRR